MSSLGTTRRNVGLCPSVVSAGSVAEPEMNASPARPNSGPTASTSWLPAGPTAATALVAMIDWVFCVATDGVSCVSSWARVTSVPFALLSSATANCAKCNCSRPTCATGPVNGPSIAIVALQLLPEPELDAEAAALEPPPQLELLLLLLPHPAATSAVSATAASVSRTFITLSSSGVGPDWLDTPGFRLGKTR